jgi:integrase
LFADFWSLFGVRACQRAGVRYRAPKHFRHTYAHRVLTAGENLAAISTELWHKDVSITARVYAGFLTELKGRNFGSLVVERYGETRR